MGTHTSISYESAFRLGGGGAGGSALTHEQVPYQQRGRKLPFKAMDHRLQILATKPTNEALSIEGGQQRRRRSREIRPSARPHASLLHIPPNAERRDAKHAANTQTATQKHMNEKSFKTAAVMS